MQLHITSQYVVVSIAIAVVFYHQIIKLVSHVSEFVKLQCLTELFFDRLSFIDNSFKRVLNSYYIKSFEIATFERN